MGPLSGYLLANTSGASIGVSQLVAIQPRHDGGPTLRHLNGAFGLPWWDAFELEAPHPLADEPSEVAGPFRYSVYVVRGFSKIVLLAERKKIADYIIRLVFDISLAQRLRKVAILLDDVVRFCQSEENEFLITSLSGRFGGPARQLRSISLYGDDVTDSAIFREYGHLFNVTVSGIGRRHFPGLPTIKGGEDGEILRLGNDGFVTASLSDQARALEFSKVIRFIVSHDWIETWVPRLSEGAGQGQIG